VFFVPRLGYTPHSLEIQIAGNGKFAPGPRRSAGVGAIGEKSGRYRIYLFTSRPYIKSGDILRGVKLMNGELAFLALVLLRIVMPISILLSFGTWIERRDVASAED
jgi:hypothetical protein